MPNKSLSRSSLLSFQKYSSLLVGNEAYIPFTAADDILEEIVLTSNSSVVTFTGLGSYTDYKHLQIRMVARTDRSDGVVDSFTVELNNDTGSNYTTHLLEANGSGIVSQASTGQSATFAGIVTGNTAPANSYGPAIIDILDFSNTSKNTTIRCLSGSPDASSRIEFHSGLWIDTSAVTEIDLIPGRPNFLSGSRFSLIGVR